MRLSFLPADMHLVRADDRYVITVEGSEVYTSTNEKNAIRAFNKLRTDLEKQFPARELTKEQKQEALKRLAGDSVLREVRNSTRKSKFQNPKQGRFDNR
jgi:hypothetical protein